MKHAIQAASIAVAVLAAGWCIAALAPAALAQGGGAAGAQGGAVAGQAVAFDRAKGNCLACHTMKGGDVPSNVGPELSDMKARFPQRKDLFAVIYDEETRNPQTVMPPFGKNHILSEQEINEVVDFLETL
jgi:sulfur-oxidizing protein SoxX